MPGVQRATKRKIPKEDPELNAKRTRSFSEVDERILTENARRLQDQKKRSIYVSLQGNLNHVSDSMLKALHPDILHVNRISHSAFLVFPSEAVRDKAFPIIEKARIKSHPIRIDYCCGKSKVQQKNTKQPYQDAGLDLSQLVVSDLPNDTTQNKLEIIFPKANDIKILKKKHTAHITFGNCSDAFEAFKKGKTLKISSVPVVVRYRVNDLNKKDARHGEENDENEEAGSKVAKKKLLKSSTAIKPSSEKRETAMKTAQSVESSEESERAVEDTSDEDEIDSAEDEYEEFFEEIEVEESDFEDESEDDE